MPKISDGVRIYNDPTAREAARIGLANTKDTIYRMLDTHWRQRPELDQFTFGAMMWAGAIQNPGDASIASFLTKLFVTIHRAGLIYNASRSGSTLTLHDAAANNLPLGSFLSGGGRIIIQLPVRTAYDDAGTAFFNWLTAEVRAAGRLITRSAATHALSDRSPAVPLFGNRQYRLAEERGKMTGLRGFFKNAIEHNHYGVNIALGGDGNKNPFNGNIVRADGAHGHLYIYHNPKNVGQCAGIMVGAENSAPHIMSQTMVPHDIRAISEDYSPCGTRKWTALTSGPNSRSEAMIVDLSDGWTWLQPFVAQFALAHLDDTPTATLAALRGDDYQRTVIYAVKDVLRLPGLPATRKAALEAHLQVLLTTQGLTKKRLREILTECGKQMGVTDPFITASGQMTPALKTAVPAAVQSAMSACSTGWPHAA
jgi:hypothetical protein